MTLFQEGLNALNIGSGAVATGLSAGVINNFFMVGGILPEELPIIGGIPSWAYFGVAAGVSSALQGAIFNLLPRFIQNPLARAVVSTSPMLVSPVLTGANLYVLDNLINWLNGNGLALMDFTPFLLGAGAEIVGMTVSKMLMGSEIAIFGSVAGSGLEQSNDLPLHQEDIALTANTIGGFGIGLF